MKQYLLGVGLLIDLEGVWAALGIVLPPGILARMKNKKLLEKRNAWIR